MSTDYFRRRSAAPLTPATPDPAREALDRIYHHFDCAVLLTTPPRSVGVSCDCGAANAYVTLADALADRDALRADKARLDWLEGYDHQAHPHHLRQHIDVEEGCLHGIFSYSVDHSRPYESLRAAIDAARAAEEGGR